MRGSACSRHMRTISRGTPGIVTIIVSAIRTSPTGCGSHWIRQDLSAGDDPGLFGVSLRHLQPTLGEELPDARDERLVDHRGLARESADGLTSEVVVGGTDASGADDQVGLVDSGGKSPRETVKIVADLDDVEQLDPLSGKLLREEGGIGVREMTADQLAADGKHVGAHPKES